MNTCGDCRFWMEAEHPERDGGKCYGGPPAVVIAPRREAVVVSPNGQPVGSAIGPVAIRPGLPRTERACGMFQPRPQNGEQ
ncbi:MAG: hypothetical protein ACE5GE_16755 [Phycisphaerae bacterium]